MNTPNILPSGHLLSDFSIVYATKPDGLVLAAHALYSYIVARYGVCLPVVTDSEAERECEILIGKTNRNESQKLYAGSELSWLEYIIACAGNKIMLCSAGVYSAHVAVEYLCNHYMPFEEAANVIMIPEILKKNLWTTKKSALTPGADIRIMSTNILASRWGGTDERLRIEIIAHNVACYNPDIIGIQEVADGWTDIIRAYIGDNYEYIHPYTPEGEQNYSTILYRKDKYNVIESGIHYYKTHGVNKIRLITYAIFEDKQTGVRFAHCNTHWSFESVEIQLEHAIEGVALSNRIIQEYNIPVFHTGDFNATPESESYRKFLECGDLQDTFFNAEKLINGAYSGCHNPGSYTMRGQNNIDKIAATKNVRILTYETIIGNEVIHLSDHCPRYADVILPKVSG